MPIHTYPIYLICLRKSDICIHKIPQLYKKLYTRAVSQGYIWLSDFIQGATKDIKLKRKRGTGPVSSRFRSAFVAGFPLGWP